MPSSYSASFARAQIGLRHILELFDVQVAVVVSNVGLKGDLLGVVRVERGNEIARLARMLFPDALVDVRAHFITRDLAVLVGIDLHGDVAQFLALLFDVFDFDASYNESAASFGAHKRASGVHTVEKVLVRFVIVMVV